MNPQQFAFFSALRGKNRDVFVVGDPLQSIYGWNGAEPSLFDTLPEKLGGAHIVHLVNNYRCSPVIVAAGLHVLTNNGIPATARSTKLDGDAITVQGYANEHDEANGIALLATQAHRSLARWSDIAVLVRTNTQREIVAGALKKHHIPVLTRGQSAVVAPLLQEVAALTHRYALADWALELRMASEPDSPEFLLSEQVNEFLQDHPTGAAHGSMFMSWLSTVGQRTNLSEDGIELLTFHAAKGREWNTVFIAGAEQGLLPHSSSRTAAQKAEEVRLAYVAITRAAEKLFVTHAAERNSRKANPSKYFVNLPLGETTAARMPEEIMEYAKAVSAATPKGALRAWRKERARQLNTTVSKKNCPRPPKSLLLFLVHSPPSHSHPASYRYSLSSPRRIRSRRSNTSGRIEIKSASASAHLVSPFIKVATVKIFRPSMRSIRPSKTRSAFNGVGEE